MLRRYIILRAAKNLKQAKVRTFLTALAISVGAATICLALAAGNGANHYVDEKTKDIDFSEIQVFGKTAYNTETKMQESVELTDADLAKIREIDGVKSADWYNEHKGYLIVKAESKDKKVVSEIQDKLKDEYSVSSNNENFAGVRQAIDVVAIGLAGFGGLAILAAVFGIINTQYISVLERTRQIGLMKALGMKKGDIGKLFRYEAAWVGAFGGILGVGIALLVQVIANPIINGLVGNAQLGELNLISVDFWQSIILILGLMIIAVLSGFFPARRAAKLDPIEALRTE